METELRFIALSPLEFDQLKDKEDVTILDVRTKEEVEESPVDKAVNIPLDQLNPLTFKDLNKENHIVVICEHGVRSKAACKFLKGYFQNLYNLEGGLDAYRRYNGEESRSETETSFDTDGPISPSMTIGETIQKYPKAADIMLGYGLHCIGCSVNPFESIQDGARGHGMAPETFSKLLSELNEMAKNESDNQADETKKEIPNTITLTEVAIKKVNELLKKDNKEDHHLRIEVAPGGCSGFKYRLTFDNDKYPDDIVFEQEGFNAVIDPESLKYMKGSTINYLDGLDGSGFKIENPNAKEKCGCGKSFS